MTLYDGEKGGVYEVDGVYVEEPITRRLQALGLKGGALIIQVRGTRLALGKHISSGIEIKEERHNG